MNTELFLEVEKNDETVFKQFDKKNKQTLDVLQKEKGFEELRKQIANYYDQAKEERKKKGVSYTKTWAYNYYRDNKNPKGVFRRVNKALYKKLKKEDKLDKVPWKVVVDLDKFIASHKFPSSITEPSVGRWICDFEKKSKEYKRCLIGFNQSGGDRKVFYEFDFSTMAWVKENPFQYEILGRTSFSWVDDNQILVRLDGMTYHNHSNPNDQVDLKEAASFA